MALIDANGTLVSTVNLPYDFLDKSGARVVGESLAVWLAQGAEVAPSKLKLRDRGLFDRLRTAGPGSAWSLHCEMVTFDGVTSLVATAATSSRPAGLAPVAAGNGVK